MRNAAVITTIEDFLSEYTEDQFINECNRYVKNDCELPINESNDRAWSDCFNFLRTNLPTESPFGKFHIIFEFMMTDSTKRADVIILTSQKVIILEFKQKAVIKKDDIAQVAGYSRSITNYHYETSHRNMNVSPHLVLTKGIPTENLDIINTLHSDNFRDVVKEILNNEVSMTEQECTEWVNSPFHPLPSLATATLKLFREGELPNIKNIQEGDIKNTLDVIYDIIDDSSLKKNIIFVAGVPGAGKTLVGLKTVYDYGNLSEENNPIYLSGNAPLVNILQNTLSSSKFDRDGESYVQDMKYFKKNAYIETVPKNKIIVFDEAQRAWDIGKAPYNNEAKQLLRIGDKVAEKYQEVTIICLIGEGQAIHLKEETGTPMWAEALEHKADWNVFVPNKFGEMFSQVSMCKCLNDLMLDTSIRNDFINVSPWVEAILDLDLPKAKKLYKEMLSQGFKCWSYRGQNRLEKNVQYLEENYPGDHTGLIVSSHLKNPDGQYGKVFFGNQYNGNFIKADEAYEWYTEGSKKLNKAASEFLIQGLELEFPIIGFIGDYYIENGKWVVSDKATDPGLNDLEEIIKNVYRILMTRSRKGMFLYIPVCSKLNETYMWFSEMLDLV